VSSFKAHRRRAKEIGGGIIIPTPPEKPSQGEVTGSAAVATSGKLIPIDLEIATGVLFGKWSGTESDRRRRPPDHEESDIMGCDRRARCQEESRLTPRPEQPRRPRGFSQDALSCPRLSRAPKT